jgi:DNA-binding FadR family transcriptional regulator
VIANGWQVGTSLGSEPELRERFGVSQTVLREAVRLLEHHQVARMRRGPGGGLIVVAPDGESAVRALLTYLEYTGASMADVLLTRRQLEPMAAELTAGRIGESAIGAIRAAVEDGDAPGLWLRHPLHQVLSEQSGNPVLQVFIDVLDTLTYRYVGTSWRVPDPAVQASLAEASHRWHRQIADAVISGDASLARSRLGAHLDDLAARLAKHPVRHEVNHRPPPSGSVAAPGATLAETVALRIYDEITQQGWPVGQVLGSEPELMRRYGVSRSVLRAAVRLLEFHSVVRPRQGPNGGLVVTRPDVRASIDATTTYLTYRGAAAEDLRAVRDALVLGAIVAVGEEFAGLDGAGRRRRLDGLTDDFPVVLARLSGNPALTVFLEIVAELMRRRGVPAPGPSAALEGVADALVAGDAGLAQHRLRRHLGTLR